MNSMHLIRGGRPSWCAQEEKLKQFDQGGYNANGNDNHRSQLNNEPIFQFSKISFTKSLGNRFRLRFWYTRFPQRRINLWVSQVMVGICQCPPWIILWKKWASCDISGPITAKKFAGNECKECWIGHPDKPISYCRSSVQNCRSSCHWRYRYMFRQASHRRATAPGFQTAL